jgi:hypothetical protein
MIHRVAVLLQAFHDEGGDLLVIFHHEYPHVFHNDRPKLARKSNRGRFSIFQVDLGGHPV